MRVSVAAVLGLLAHFSTNSHAFLPLQSSSYRQKGKTAVLLSKNLHEFDFLFKEGSENAQQISSSRRRIHLRDDRRTVLVSSTFAAPGVGEDVIQDGLKDEQISDGAYDPYADIGLETPQLSKIKQVQDQSFSQKFESKLKTMDLQDIISTFIIPSIIAFAGLRWGYNKVAGRVGDTADSVLDSFASEMIYHDGDFEEMKMCHSDYSKKLVWLGPRKTSAMLKRYLELYSKKRTVSPQAIRYVGRSFRRAMGS